MAEAEKNNRPAKVFDYRILIVNFSTTNDMSTKMTANGVSTTTTPDTEQYDFFYVGFHSRRKRYQYDCRHTDGELFSCVAPTLTECQRKRDEWLNKKTNN